MGDEELTVRDILHKSGWAGVAVDHANAIVAFAETLRASDAISDEGAWEIVDRYSRKFIHSVWNMMLTPDSDEE